MDINYDTSNQVQDQLDINRKLTSSKAMQSFIKKYPDEEPFLESIDEREAKKSPGKKRKSNKATFVASPGLASKSLFVQLYENDLNQVRESTFKELDTMKEEKDIFDKEVETLVEENKKLKSFINRYKSLIAEFEPPKY